MLVDAQGILERYNQLKEQITLLSQRYDRTPPTLLAVSKKQPIEAIRVLLTAGHRYFAENRVQEAQEKWCALLEEFPDTELHLVGSLQSNKAKETANLFHYIHTLDRDSLKQKLEALPICPDLFIQINTGEEEQKSGVLPNDANSFIESCKELPVKGLMCIPPVNDVPAPHFDFLKRLGAQHNLPLLSMGMSSDWQTALQLGASHIRVGTAIFGERLNQ